jgi:hypothetical protein
MGDPLKEIIEELTFSINKADKQKSEANFSLVQMKLSELNGALRELHQAITADRIKTIIHKLEKQQPLNSDELTLIRDWIVGDAINYLKDENNINSWMSFLNTLSENLNNLYTEEIQPENVLHLCALSQIAIRLIPNIIFYISERERVARFDRAISDGIDSSEAKAYKDILLAKLQSTDY